jgi:hypothetical protein
MHRAGTCVLGEISLEELEKIYEDWREENGEGFGGGKAWNVYNLMQMLKASRQ